MPEKDLAQADPEIAKLIDEENRREHESMRLIASENYASRAVMEATGSCLTNKYSEGYAHKRYYEGQAVIDQVEELAIGRLKKLFAKTAAAGGEDDIHVNVQPYSGSPANLAVYLAFLQPGDVVMGLGLPAGGHLTHGHTVSITGKYFKSIPYGVRREDHRIDMDEVRKLAKEHRPKVIWAGTTAYPRTLDFKAFREIADEVGAYLMVDMAHIAGLVAGGQHPSPFPHCHVATTTTHKSLRGPRGGVILTNDEDLAKKFNSAVFPGLQGGPLMHIIAAKAVAFGEALQPSFKDYAAQIVRNAKTLADTLKAGGLDIVSGGTDNHLMLVDLRKKNATGKRAEAALGRGYITCNKNGIPFDPEKPFVTSGIRLGTPAGTTRGFREAEFVEIGNLIVEVLDGLKAANSDEGNAAVEAAVREKVVALTGRFPMYPYM